MDDGTYTNPPALCTNGYTLTEINNMVNMFKRQHIPCDKYALKGREIGSYLIKFYRRNQAWQPFKEMIKPYIINCMQYKLGERRYCNWAHI